LEKEIKKDGIPMLDTGENPEAPQPREMIDLEVIHQFIKYINPFPLKSNTYIILKTFVIPINLNVF